MIRPADPPIPRRRALRILGGSAAGLGTACLTSSGLALLTGCDDGDGESEVRLPLADLPEGVRIRVALGVEPVEVLNRRRHPRPFADLHPHRLRSGLERSRQGVPVPVPQYPLRCRRQGPLGPARLPLESVPTRVEGTEVLIGG